MNISKIAIYRPVTTLMFSLALVFLGVISSRELAVQRFPDITFPALSYNARMLNGDLSPEETNDQLTRPVEKMVGSLKGVREMQSTTLADFFYGFAQFDYGTDMRFRVIELQDKVNGWLATQQGGEANSARRIEVQINTFSTEQLSERFVEAILSVPLGQEAKIPYCSDLIRRKLKSIDGIAQVDIAGVMQPNLVLETSNDELQARGLDVDRLVQTINNHAREKSWLGTLKDGRREHEIYFDMRVKNLDELLALPVDDAGVYPVGKLATPRKEVEEGERVFRINGKKAVQIRISKEKDKNTIRMGRAVRARLDELELDLPAGFKLEVTEDAGAELEEMIGEIMKLALAGAVLAMLVLLVFVRNWRIAAVVVLSIPVSIIINFNAMYAFGLSINIFTLLGLAAGVGMLIDNAIVVVENVFRHAQRSSQTKTPEGMQAIAWRGSREIGWAIMMSTATTLAVFIPMAFFQDSMMVVLREMALSFVFPLAVSLLIALTLIPMLASKVLSASAVAAMHQQAGNRNAQLKGWGFVSRPGRPPRNILRELILFCARGSLRHPIRLIFILVALMLATLFVALIKLAIQGMNMSMDSMRTERITLYAKPRLNSSLEEVDLLFQGKEEQLARELEATDFFDSFSSNFNADGGQIELKIAKKYQQYPVQVFEAGFKFLEEKTDQGEFKLKPFREVSQQAMMAMQSLMSGGQNRDYVVLTGENIDGMQLAAEMLKEELEQNELVERADIEVAEGNKEIHFEPDLELIQLMQANLQSLNTFFSARNERGMLTNLELEEDQVLRRVTVLVKEDAEEEEEQKVKQTLTELKRLQVPVQNGGVTPLSHLGVFTPYHPAPEISKINRQRQLRVSFSFEGSYYQPEMERERQDALREIQTRHINNRQASGLARLPAGVSAHIAGTLEDVEESAQLWKRLFWLAVLAIYLVMAFFFNSITTPLIILMTIPLACVGSVWGVIAFNAPLDMVAMLGSIILVGLVVNNGILLIEYTRQLERRRGYRRIRALMTAVSFRFRPILMTSMTTVLGLLPILLSKEAEAQTRSLVAVLAGGIVVSALLTLVAIPTFYNIFAIWTEQLSAWRAFTIDKMQLALGLRLKPFDLPFNKALAQAAPALAAPALAGHDSPSSSPGARPVTLKLPPPLPTAPPATLDQRAPAASTPSAIELGEEPALPAPLPAPSKAAAGLRIEIDNVSRIYGAFSKELLLRALPSRKHPYGHRPLLGSWALRNVSLTIESGMFGLLGPNGAGKTTLMKILTGIIPPTTGAITIGGRDLATNRKEIRQFISYLPQHSGVNQALTLNQYLNFCAPHRGLHNLAERRRAIEQAITGVGLQHVRDVPMKRFSGGMRQRAVIAQFLLRPQPILIVDEPTAGLDPVERVRFRLLLSQLARTRIVILSTHIVDDITSSCKRVAVLHRGEVVYCGGLERIVEDAKGQLWNIVKPPDEALDAPAKSILYRHHVEGGVQYRFFSPEALPGAEAVEPTFEDAYVALLLRHDASVSPVEPGP